GALVVRGFPFDAEGHDRRDAGMPCGATRAIIAGLPGERIAIADMRISEDFIIGQASLVNEIEDQRDTFNDALKSAWSDYREELKLLGLTGKEIAAEVAALKSAISDTRMTAEDRAKAEEKADGKDGYLAILSGPRARARIREAKSEPQPTKAAGQVEQRAALAISGERVAATSSVE